MMKSDSCSTIRDGGGKKTILDGDARRHPATKCLEDFACLRESLEQAKSENALKRSVLGFRLDFHCWRGRMGLPRAAG